MPHSDSEDEEYVPDTKAESSSSSDGESGQEQFGAKRPRMDPEPEDLETQQRKRKELWRAFQESVASGTDASTSEAKPKTVKVEKRYMFAGKEIKEIVEVASDSAEAKKWPIISPKSSSADTLVSVPTPASDTASLASASTTTASSAPSSHNSGPKRGPRKPKVTLGAIPGSSAQSRNAPKKLTTLEKSAMDWRSHLSTADNDTLKDELEANRKQGGGGYLEKVEFLDRVSERRESLLDASKSGKRRRG